MAVDFVISAGGWTAKFAAHGESSSGLFLARSECSGSGAPIPTRSARAAGSGGAFLLMAPALGFTACSVRTRLRVAERAVGESDCAGLVDAGAKAPTHQRAFVGLQLKN